MFTEADLCLFPLFWFDPISELGCGKLFYSMLEGGLSWSEVDNPRKHLVRNVSLCIAVRLRLRMGQEVYLVFAQRPGLGALTPNGGPKARVSLVP